VAKFTIVREEAASEATKRIYKQILDVKHLRSVPNFFKTLAKSPAVLEGTWNVYRNVSTQGSISEVLKEMMFGPFQPPRNVRTAKRHTSRFAGF
jgi:hypothetical protein